MLSLTLFAGDRTDTNPAGRVTIGWDDLPGFLEAATTRGPKSSGGYLLGSHVREGARRANATCGPATVLIVDYDDFEGEPDWTNWPGEILAHSSGSHLTVCDDNPTGAQRWRVYVRLAEPIPPEDYARVRDALTLPSGAHVRALSQPAFLPTYLDQPPEWVRAAGAPLAWRLLPLPPPSDGTSRLDPEHLTAEITYSDPEVRARLEQLLLVGKRPTKDGDQLLWAAACDLRTRYHASEASTVAVLQAWHVAVFPDINWPDHRVHRAAERAGWQVPAPVVPAAAPPEPVAEAAPTPPPRIATVSAAALSEPLGPVPWLIEGLGIAPGRPTVLTGRAGTGKTFAIQDLALAVASGQPAFNDHRFLPSHSGPVLHIDVDQGRYATARRYQQLARGRGLDLAKLPISAAFFTGYLARNGGVDPVAQRCLANTCEGHALCVVDSLRGIAPGMDENSSEFGAVLQALAEITDSTGCTFVVLHHDGKGGTDGQSSAGRGTSAIQDRAGGMWQITREAESDQVSWTCAKVSELGLVRPAPFCSRLDQGEGQESCRIVVAPPPAEVSDEVTRDERLAITAVLTRPEYVDLGCSRTGLEGVKTGVANHRLRRVLAVMVDRREVVIVGTGPKQRYRIERDWTADH
jgi:AAA domain